MNHTAHKVIPIYSNDNSRTPIQTCTVVSVEEGRILLDRAGVLLEAQRAFSCMVEPIPGDIVLTATDESSRVFVLGILHRKGSQTMDICFPGDTQIRSDHGGLALNARESISLVSPAVSCISKTAVHKSTEAVVACETLTARGKELNAAYKTVSIVSNLINTMARQAINAFRGYLRSTENADVVKAGQMDRKIEGLMTVDSKYTMMNSSKSTKIDGEKIFMG